MGFDYAYELIADHRKADEVIRAIARNVQPSDRDRLLASLPFDSTRWLQNIARDEWERRYDELCLSFLFPADKDVIAYDQRAPIEQPIEGYISVGCIYASMEVGSRMLVFRVTAATTGMSFLFQNSAAVRSTWIAIAREVDAHFLLFDEERSINHVVWPVECSTLNAAYDADSVDAKYLAIARAIGIDRLD